MAEREKPLDLASQFEQMTFDDPWNDSAENLARELDIQLPDTPASVTKKMLLELHHKLAPKLLELLADTYEIKSEPRYYRLQPKHQKAEGTIVALHGAWDRGKYFAGVLVETLLEEPLEVMCPNSRWVEWTESDMPLVVDLYASIRVQPSWIVGFSNGGNMALSARNLVADKVVGAVAIGSAPWLLSQHNDTTPTIYVHGVRDTLCPIEKLRQFMTETGASRSSALEIPQWGHSFPYRIFFSQVWPLMRRWTKA